MQLGEIWGVSPHASHAVLKCSKLEWVGTTKPPIWHRTTSAGVHTHIQMIRQVSNRQLALSRWGPCRAMSGPNIRNGLGKFHWGVACVCRCFFDSPLGEHWWVFPKSCCLPASFNMFGALFVGSRIRICSLDRLDQQAINQWPSSYYPVIDIGIRPPFEVLPSNRHQQQHQQQQQYSHRHHHQQHHLPYPHPLHHPFIIINNNSSLSSSSSSSLSSLPQPPPPSSSSSSS